MLAGVADFVQWPHALVRRCDEVSRSFQTLQKVTVKAKHHYNEIFKVSIEKSSIFDFFNGTTSFLWLNRVCEPSDAFKVNLALSRVSFWSCFRGLSPLEGHNERETQRNIESLNGKVEYFWFLKWKNLNFVVKSCLRIFKRFQSEPESVTCFVLVLFSWLESQKLCKVIRNSWFCRILNITSSTLIEP